MRIAFLNPQGNFDPKDSYWTEHPDFGGQLVYVKELARALAAKGHQVDIFTRLIDDPQWPEFSGKRDGYPDIPRVRILRMRCGGRGFLPKEELWPYLNHWVNGIHQHFKSEGVVPDFLTGHYGDGGISAAMLARRLRVPFSFTGHSLGAQKLDKFLATSSSFEELNARFHFNRRILAEGVSMKFSAVNFVSSTQERFEQYNHQLYQDFIDVNDASRFSVVPPGVNLQVFSPSPVAGEDGKLHAKMQAILQHPRYHEREQLPFVVLSARIDPKKNHMAVLQAFAQSELLRNKANLLIVVRNVPDPYADLSGLKPDERKIVHGWIEHIERHRLQPYVVFASVESQAELGALYRFAAQRSSFFCLPALYEPFGLAVIESMSCGLPVVATRHGGPAEIVDSPEGEAGILVSPENLEDLRAGLEQALQMPTRDYQLLAARGIRRVQQRYTWEATAEGYLETIGQRIPNARPWEIVIPQFFLSGEPEPVLEWEKTRKER
ncbi:MAG TPA: glycosyltransferase [Thermotogota bacterium]|nr:glycosyltransferase [Thermotogota bacterium]